MRKIETQMNAAIASYKNWASGNTTVSHTDEHAEVRLHGNLIARIGEGWIQLWDGGWQSNTTKSRLNAILDANGLPGEGVFQRDWAWFYRTTDGTEVPFFSGMRIN